MAGPADKIAKWSARILAVVVSFFVGIFALDAIDEGLVALLVHLVPAMLLLLVVGLSWRWEWVGAAAFTALAVVYAVLVRRWDWILVLSCPLAAAGLLYLLSWRMGCGASRS